MFVQAIMLNLAIQRSGLFVIGQKQQQAESCCFDQSQTLNSPAI